MRQQLLRTLTLLLLAVGLAACGTPQVTGVVSVEIPGGDREVPHGATMVLGAIVTAGSGSSKAVTWQSSDAAVAAIDADGVLTALSAGSTTVTATSTADATKSDSIVVTVVVGPDDATAFDATYVPPGPASPPVLGASLVIVDADLILAASFTEVQAGLFMGPVAPIAADGSVSVILPAAADVPATVLVDASFLVPDLNIALDCELVASGPSTRVTPVLVQPFTLPGVFLTSFQGVMPAFLTDSEVNPVTLPVEEQEQVALYVYVYSDGSTTVATSGTDCQMASFVTNLAVDVSLSPGWNQLVWTLEFDELGDPELARLGNGDAQELFLHPLAF